MTVAQEAGPDRVRSAGASAGAEPAGGAVASPGPGAREGGSVDRRAGSADGQGAGTAGGADHADGGGSGRPGVGDGSTRLGDLRLAGPIAVTWVVTVLLVGRAPEALAVGVAAAVVCATALGAVAWLGRAAEQDGAPWHRSVVRTAVHAGASLVLTTALLVGLVAVAVAVGQTRRDPLVVRDATGRTVSAEVLLTRDLSPGDRSVVGTLVAVRSRSDEGGDGLRVPVRVVPALDAPHRSVVPAGTVVRVRGQLEADVPGSATAFVLLTRGPVSVSAGPRGLLAWSAAARGAFFAVTADLPEPGAALLRGLAIGDRSGLDPATEQAMETSALTHLTAVSGSNCAVLVAVVVLLGRAVGAPRAVRAVVAIAVLLGFVVLVRPDPSITRATVMAVVVLVVHLTGRPVRGVPLIALAVLGMLVADPWTARSFAFALSVLATTGIVVLAPPLTALLARRLWTPVAAAVAVPVAAQVACWPVTIPLSPALPTYAVPTNLFAEVLAPVATVAGLAACLLAPVWSWGAGVLAAVGWGPAAAIGTAAHVAARLPAAGAPWPAGAVGVVAATAVSTALAAAVLVGRRLRRVLAVGAVVLGLLGVGAVAVPEVVARATVPTGWTVAMCDVGQGDATLVRSGGRTALVDTGDEPEQLRACLDLLGVDRIDLLVLTHFDRDHVGAVAEVAGLVETALVGPVGRPADERVVSELRDAGADVRRASDGTGGVLGDLRWRVLWPPAAEDAAGNAASIVVRVDPMPGVACPGCVSAVLLGDLGEDAQRRLRRDAPPGALDPVDVVKVAHHGSADQYPELYRVLAARVGLIGVGADNDYGHPTPSALEMLAAAGTAPYRTDQDGTIVVRGTDDPAAGAGGGADADAGAARALEVWTERSDGRLTPTRLAGPSDGGVRTERVALTQSPRSASHLIVRTECMALPADSTTVGACGPSTTTRVASATYGGCATSCHSTVTTSPTTRNP